MKNTLDFDKFLETLKTTNRHLDFYVDWEKCLKNRDDIAISLNHLNFLLGKDENVMQECIAKLFDEFPKAFNVLGILIATRDNKENILDSNHNLCELQGYFVNPTQIYNFIVETGLLKIFSDRKIKDLNDFVFGIEVGLDTNARKNRSGKVMESYLSQIFQKAGLNFQEQVDTKNFSDIYQAFGEDIKRFDFVIYANRTYFLECNFYSSGGSKLNETARSYQELALKFDKLENKEFVWITDGKGWLDAKNKLQEAYKSIRIYNLSNLNEFIKEICND